MQITSKLAVETSYQPSNFHKSLLLFVFSCGASNRFSTVSFIRMIL